MIHGVSQGIGDSVVLRQQRLQHAAEQFEGMLLQQMLKPLQEHEEESPGFGDAMRSYSTEAMATAMARRGGLGFADRMVHSVEQQQNKSVPASSPGTIGR